MKKNIMYILLGIVILFIILLIIGKIFLFKNDTNSLTTLKVSEVTHSIFYTPFYVAIENGYFEDEGIKIDLYLISGSDNVAASVLSKDTQIGLAGPESAIYVYLGGEEDYLQVFSGLTKRDGQFIISRNSEEFIWNNLIGKEILVGRSTGMPALSFYRALSNMGINLDDVNINTAIDFSELSGTFISGIGDYVNLFEPIATNIEDNGYGYVVTSVGLYSDAFPYTAFYAKKSYIEENTELLTKFTKAIKRGIDYTLKSTSRDVANAIKKQFSDIEIDDLVEMIDRYKEADVWLDTPYIEEDFYNTIVELLLEYDLIDNQVDYKSMVINLYE